MKDSIIVNVSKLRSIVQYVRRSGCDVVSLSILESDDFDGETIPASISFSGCKSVSPDEWYDFDDVEAVPNESELEAKSLEAMHMSSNLL